MLLVGWLLGLQLQGVIDEYDHIIAFALLAFIGGKMIYDALTGKKEKGENEDKLNMWDVFCQVKFLKNAFKIPPKWHEEFHVYGGTYC